MISNYGKNLTENVNDFGEPIAEAVHIHYKELLNELLAAVEMHQAIMAGAAEEDAEDPLQATVDKIKEALDPEKTPEDSEEEIPDGVPDEDEPDEEEPEKPAAEESVEEAGKKKFKHQVKKT